MVLPSVRVIGKHFASIRVDANVGVDRMVDLDAIFGGVVRAEGTCWKRKRTPAGTRAHVLSAKVPSNPGVEI